MKTSLRDSFINASTTAKGSLRASWRNSGVDLSSFADAAPKSKLDKITKLVGIVGWGVAYVAIIAVGHQLQISLIHRVLIAYDLVWEGGKTFFWSDGDTSLQLFVGVFWFGFDVEIWRIFLIYGDGTGDWHNEMYEFGIWFVIFCVISYFVTKMGKSVCRLWRHTSELVSLFIQISILSKSFEMKMPLQRTMAWSMMVGNVAYLYSVRTQYQGWQDFVKHPVRFLMVLVCFIPAIFFNLIFILISHELIAIV